MTYGWIWIAVIVIAVVVEIFTKKMIAVWFVPGSVAALVIDILDKWIVWQILLCLIPTAVGIIFSKVILKGGTDLASGIETVIGERCVVTERIDSFAGCGEVKVNGQIWSARGVLEEDTFEEGATLRVVAIEGVKLICKK